jgi:alpha-1,2-mannosyltransferase
MDATVHEPRGRELANTIAPFWLTPTRLRAHATILAVCLWTLYVWNLATPGLRDRNNNLKGTDFLHFYILGSLAESHDAADLYDMNAQAALATERMPQAAGLRYLPLYPPQVSILFEPFAHLSYGWALAMWWGCSTLLYAVCCFSVWRACPNLQPHAITVFLLALAFPAFFHLIAWGQTSALALACFTLAFFLLRAKQAFLSGVVLGFLICKPQLGLAAAVIFLLIGDWKIVGGAILSSAAQLWLGVLYYGMAPLQRWIVILRHLPAVLPSLEPRPYQTHSLRTFWTMLVPWREVAIVLYVASAIFALGLTIAVWRGKSAPLGLRYSSLLVATVLISPHLTVYDLVILAPAFLLTANWLFEQLAPPWNRMLGTLLYLVYMLPLLGPVARWTHVQLSVIAMAAWLYALWRASRTEYAPAKRTGAAEVPSV